MTARDESVLPGELSRVVILELGGLGDALRTMTFVREFRAVRQDCEIHLVTLHDFLPARRLRSLGLSSLVCLGRAGPGAWPRAVRQLRDRLPAHVDALFLTQSSVRKFSYALVATLRARVKIGYATWPWTRLLDVTLPPAPPTWEGGVRSAFAALGLTWDETPTPFPLVEDVEAEEQAKSFLAARGVTDRTKCIVINPYTKDARARHGRSKLWPEAHWLELGTRLLGREDSVLLLPGTKAERTPLLRLAERLGPRAIVQAGETDIVVLACMIRRCALAVMIDSGLNHLVAAAHPAMPCITLWGPTDPRQFGHVGSCRVNLRSPLAEGCRNCPPEEDGRLATSCRCLAAITPSMVLEHALAFLAEAAARAKDS